MIWVLVAWLVLDIYFSNRALRAQTAVDQEVLKELQDIDFRLTEIERNLPATVVVDRTNEGEAA